MQSPQGTEDKLEFPKGSGVTIRPIENTTNGQAYGKSYLVTLPGKVTGKRRERKQFDTLEAAKDYATNACKGVRAVGERFLELEHADREATLRLLNGIKQRGGEAQDVVDDVLAALKAIGASPLRLVECVNFALPRLAPAKIVTVSECAESYLATLTGQVSAEHERTTKIYLSRVTAKHGLLPVSHLDAVKINELVSGVRKRDRKGKNGKVIPGEAASPKFREHVLGATRALVRHAVSRGWLAKGIVDFDILESPRKKKGGRIAIYSPDELHSLLTHAESDLIPFLVVGAFAGLRSAEIERLDWREVDLVHGHVEVTAAKAKTASRRLVPISQNLKAWLTPLHKKTGRVFDVSTTGGNLTVRLHALANRAGLDGWRKNALRHSFISYRVAKVQNVSQVALEAGNSPQVIFSNYRELVKPAEAEKFFALVPAPAPANVTRIHAVA
jgi:integrase